MASAYCIAARSDHQHVACMYSVELLLLTALLSHLSNTRKQKQHHILLMRNQPLHLKCLMELLLGKTKIAVLCLLFVIHFACSSLLQHRHCCAAYMPRIMSARWLCVTVGSLSSHAQAVQLTMAFR